MTDFDSSIHNDDTAYNYNLILRMFFKDIGIAKEEVKDLEQEVFELMQFRRIAKRLNRKAYSDNLKKIKEIYEKILRIQKRAFIEKDRREPNWAFETIFRWIENKQTEAKDRLKSGSTVKGYLRPIRKLCDNNGIDLSSDQWKRIYSIVDESPRTGMNNPYSLEQIRKLITYPDRRVKPVVLTQVSCGCRVGAFEYLKLGHITPVFQNKDGSFEKGESLGAKALDGSRKLVASEIVIHSKKLEDEDYLSFISPESTKALDDYGNFRRQNGENITESSPAIRDLFPPDKGARPAARPNLPKRLADSSLKNLMLDAVVGTGLRPRKLSDGKHRWEFKVNQGLCMFFERTCDEQGANVYTKGLTRRGKVRHGARTEEWKTALLSYLKVVQFLTITIEERHLIRLEFISQTDQKKAREVNKEFVRQLNSLRRDLAQERQERQAEKKLLIDAIATLLPPKKRSLLKALIVPQKFQDELGKISDKKYGDIRVEIDHLADDKFQRDKNETNAKRVVDDQLTQLAVAKKKTTVTLSELAKRK
ncbi:MAG: hypothetical protein PXY39_02970 [archaeon]|nr:hypothetical protein [archaeon]